MKILKLILIVVIVLLFSGAVYSIYKYPKNETVVDNQVKDLTPSVESTKNSIKATEEKGLYVDPKGRFNFQYSKEMGPYEVSNSDEDELYFGDTYDENSSSMFSVSIDSYEKAKLDYSSSQSAESTGDYDPLINGNGWKAEKLLLEKNTKDGHIPCLSKEQGVFKAVFCEIKTIGNNKFLIKYSRDTYKEYSIIKEYIIYHDGLRYELGGGKGLSYFNTVNPCEEYDKHKYEYCDKNGIYTLNSFPIASIENLKNHPKNKYEILVEEILESLTFTNN